MPLKLSRFRHAALELISLWVGGVDVRLGRKGSCWSKALDVVGIGGLGALIAQYDTSRDVNKPGTPDWLSFHFAGPFGPGLEFRLRVKGQKRDTASNKECSVKLHYFFLISCGSPLWRPRAPHEVIP